jgi:hypothetical protein
VTLRPKARPPLLSFDISGFGLPSCHGMNKEQIIGEIRRTAKANGGLPLGWRRFEAETGIGYCDWYRQYWTRWSDAIREAGLDEPDRGPVPFGAGCVAGLVPIGGLVIGAVLGILFVAPFLQGGGPTAGFGAPADLGDLVIAGAIVGIIGFIFGGVVTLRWLQHRYP